jgi:hypothetical protein
VEPIQVCIDRNLISISQINLERAQCFLHDNTAKKQKTTKKEKQNSQFFIPIFQMIQFSYINYIKESVISVPHHIISGQGSVLRKSMVA